MELLDKSILPQSAHHLMLLKYLLVITTLIFFTYTSILFGSLFFSLFFRRRGVRTGSRIDHRFAGELIDLVTFNKSVSFALGVVPLLSSIFGYAQLLHLTNLNVPGYLLISLIFLIIALIPIYIYKYTFHLNDIFVFAGGAGADQLMKSEIENYGEKNSRLHSKSGFYGLLLLVVSTYFYAGTVVLAADTGRWNDGFWGLIFSASTFIHYLQFLAASASITGPVVLFLLKGKSKEEADENYKAFVTSFSLKSGLIGSILFPILITASLLLYPVNSLSFELFGVTAVAIILILLVGVMFYFMIKESESRYSSLTVYLLVIVFGLLMIKDQFAFDTATRSHTALLDAKYEEYAKKSEEGSGVAPAPVSGADIYNGRCIACHRFDVKLVGPPYKQTLPKYEGKMDELIKFILNPDKKNPDYPAMPNQGLKPNEAEAIAKYLMETYKK